MSIEQSLLIVVSVFSMSLILSAAYVFIDAGVPAKRLIVCLASPIYFFVAPFSVLFAWVFTNKETICAMRRRIGLLKKWEIGVLVFLKSVEDFPVFLFIWAASVAVLAQMSKEIKLEVRSVIRSQLKILSNQRCAEEINELVVLN